MPRHGLTPDHAASRADGRPRRTTAGPLLHRLLGVGNDHACRICSRVTPPQRDSCVIAEYTGDVLQADAAAPTTKHHVDRGIRRAVEVPAKDDDAPLAVP